jgi:hypothetical protein
MRHDESVLVVAVDVVHSPAPIWSGPTSQDDVRAAFDASICVIRGRLNLNSARWYARIRANRCVALIHGGEHRH